MAGAAHRLLKGNQYKPPLAPNHLPQIPGVPERLLDRGDALNRANSDYLPDMGVVGVNGLNHNAVKV